MGNGFQNGPMGGGIDVDIITRQPVVPKSPDERAAEAKTKMEEAVFRAISLQQDVQKSPVLALMLEQFTKRLDVLAKNDTVCQTIVSLLQTMRNTIDIVPEHAHRRFKAELGNSVTLPFSPFVIPQSAPDGTPAEE